MGAGKLHERNLKESTKEADLSTFRSLPTMSTSKSRSWFHSVFRTLLIRAGQACQASPKW